MSAASPPAEATPPGTPRKRVLKPLPPWRWALQQAIASILIGRILHLLIDQAEAQGRDRGLRDGIRAMQKADEILSPFADLANPPQQCTDGTLVCSRAMTDMRLGVPPEACPSRCLWKAEWEDHPTPETD